MERRAEHRWATHALVSCRIPATPIAITLLDVSKAGCHVRISELQTVHKGISIVIDLSPTLNVLGQVIWQGGNDFGVRFDRPLTEDEVANASAGLDPPAEEPVRRYVPPSIGTWLRRRLS